MTDLLRKLDEIGGWVAADELIHHLGGGADMDAFELVEQGLVESRTEFSLTDAGRERLGLTSGDSA